MHTHVKLFVLCIVLLSGVCGSVSATDESAAPVAESTDVFAVTTGQTTDGISPFANPLVQLAASDSVVQTDVESLSAAVLPSFVADVGSRLLDTVFDGSLLRENSPGFALTMFLGRLDAASTTAMQRVDASSAMTDDVHAAPPIEWMNPNPNERLAEIDYFALMLSLTTVLVSIGLVAYRRLSAPHGIEREVEPSLAEPEPTLTDEERIMQLLEAHDGQMRQVEIVEEVEWSKAKVSRLLSQLDEDGKITKLRLGRENLICTRGREPEASRSPFAALQEN
ncbi:helix-turn-helix transcriptional regulator [Haloprofundus salinisoli]|uniref:helix-turn-helix transcriptional regulator n=1 Tax=Haloprofundus salinisoli TaxID=2876193 RepID=UPI001CCBBFA7|nr:helix-turn-helix domain-containing protein [Haloprofundus salinisoli]